MICFTKNIYSHKMIKLTCMGWLQLVQIISSNLYPITKKRLFQRYDCILYNKYPRPWTKNTAKNKSEMRNNLQSNNKFLFSRGMQIYNKPYVTFMPRDQRIDSSKKMAWIASELQLLQKENLFYTMLTKTNQNCHDEFYLC